MAKKVKVVTYASPRGRDEGETQIGREEERIIEQRKMVAGESISQI